MSRMLCLLDDGGAEQLSCGDQQYETSLWQSFCGLPVPSFSLHPADTLRRKLLPISSEQRPS